FEGNEKQRAGSEYKASAGGQNKNEAGKRGIVCSVEERQSSIKRYVQGGKELFFVFSGHASRELGVIGKACWKMEGDV
uniref:hypothetical protein n=1 Tax=Bartonella sp. AP83NXGY TaxID=3243504 RepID=UPI0035CF5E74